MEIKKISDKEVEVTREVKETYDKANLEEIKAHLQSRIDDMNDMLALFKK